MQNKVDKILVKLGILIKDIGVICLTLDKESTEYQDLCLIKETLENELKQWREVYKYD